METTFELTTRAAFVAAAMDIPKWHMAIIMTLTHNRFTWASRRPTLHLTPQKHAQSANLSKRGVTPKLTRLLPH